MNDRRVLCLSAGLVQPKKTKNLYADQHLYLNYGLLGLASVLHGHGYEPRVFHGRFMNPNKFVDDLAQQDWLTTQAPILLSVPSAFALPWARVACARIKQHSPSARIIVGGRWVVASDGAWVKRQLPDVDLVVYGTAEQRIDALMNPKRWSFIPSTDRTGSFVTEPALAEPPMLDYQLLAGFRDYQPSIEVSRGCGMGCVYCAEARAPLSDMKPAARLAEELAKCIAVYGESNIRPYFEASFFRPTSAWIQSLRDEFARHDLRLQWRTESRVDGLSPRQVSNLAATGLRVLDLGLESACRSQLLAMEKTQNPEVYLRRASELLEACHDHGVWAKVNFLLFPGETQATVAESMEWLDRHRPYIKGISANPTTVYRYGEQTASYLKNLEAFGARPVDPAALERDGFAHLHMSDALDHQEAVATCESISRSVMSETDYLDLKGFSYLPRSFRRPAVLSSVQAAVIVNAAMCSLTP